MSQIFTEFKLGRVGLKNRIVMAPMTRSRAIGNIANAMMAKHYGDRASAGLLITEGTAPSPNGLGYARIPGLFNSEQSKAWRQVTDAVHEKGGRIFVQLMHTGRVSHSLNMPAGTKVLAPSAIAASGEMWTDQEGKKAHPVPQEMTLADIRSAREEFVRSAELAMEAGFDGVELHAANGYLLEQFLNPASNKRQDEYGRDAEGRMKFVLEVAESVAKKIGPDRLGIRISPYGVFNDTGPFPGIDEFYTTLCRKLSDMGLVYLHVVDHSAMGAPPVSSELKGMLRKTFRGAYILSGGYDRKRAELDLSENKGDLVAFGRPFIANPDLVEKLDKNQGLREPGFNTFYTPGPEGYI